MKGVAIDVNSKIRAAAERGQVDVVIGDRLSGHDFLPSSDIRFGETFVNWKQLKQVWMTSQKLGRE